MTLRLLAVLGLALAALAAPASAQLRLTGEAPEVTVSPHYVCALYGHGDHAEPGPALDLSALETARRGVTYERVVSRQRQATFVVDYSSQFTPEAQAAFQRAVDIWGAHLTSPVTIRIRADFDALGERVLGQAGPLIVRLTDGFTQTWYPFALADALLERDIFPPDDEGQNYDISATFSSAFPDFYFGLDGNPRPNRPGQPGQIDFVTTVLHELGHGLGFVGSGSVNNEEAANRCAGGVGIGCIGITGSDDLRSPLIFDRLLTNAVYESVLDEGTYPNNTRRLGGLFESQALFVDSPTVARIYGGLAPIWAPAAFEPGSSFSHWDEEVIQNSSAALMTPALARGEAYQDPGDITCAFFADMGWDLGAGCQRLGVADEPALVASGLGLEPTGPNPTRGATSFRLRQPAPGAVRVTLHDALGRQLATLIDGPAQTTEDLALGTDRLAPGVYHVVARTAGGTVTRAVTVVR